VYRALALGDEVPAEIPVEITRWDMAETFGWSLEYIDSLPMSEIINYLSIRDGKAHANTSIIKKR